MKPSKTPIIQPRPSRSSPGNSGCEHPQPLSFVRTEHLSLSYGAQPAFQDVSLLLPTGMITALVGPSGCGKTSFLLCLNRLTDLIPGTLVSGRVWVGGKEVLTPGVDVIGLRRRIGMIFQKPNPFPLTIRRNIEFPLREHGITQRETLNHITEGVLRDVGLWEEVRDRLDQPAFSLSGGQQQRLCIARALALSPEALLMDEPCSALDPLSGSVIEDLILSLRGRYTILIVTHHLAQARRIADHAALFWIQNGSGRLIESGPAPQFFENPQEALTSAYLTGRKG